MNAPREPADSQPYGCRTTELPSSLCHEPHDHRRLGPVVARVSNGRATPWPSLSRRHDRKHRPRWPRTVGDERRPIAALTQRQMCAPLGAVRRVRHADSMQADDIIAPLAAWSPWLPFNDAALRAPRLPGVYLAREGAGGELAYVGMAGERRGQGLRGRLTVYRRGKAAVSGLGEAVLDRALADPAFVRAHLDELLAGRPKRAAAWAQDALRHADLHIRWAVTPDRPMAAVLERAVLDALAASPLWNRAR